MSEPGSKLVLNRASIAETGVLGVCGERTVALSFSSDLGALTWCSGRYGTQIRPLRRVGSVGYSDVTTCGERHVVGGLLAALRPDLLLDLGHEVAQMVVEVEVVPVERSHRKLCRSPLRPRGHLLSGSNLVVVAVERVDRT